MKAPDFVYVRPGSIAEALALLADTDADATPLAGGQSLMPMMNFRVAAPGKLVDLNGLAELRGLRVENGMVRIGAMTRYAELLASDDIRENIPLFGLALPHVAHAAIRNRGTIGGSVALADPAAEIPALLLVLEAEIHMQGLAGTRAIAAEDFFLGLYETALQEGEIVTEIVVPARKTTEQFGFYEFARRHGDYAMAGVALKVGGPDHCRIGFFGVADRAIRATRAEVAYRDGGVPAAMAALDDLPFDGDLNAAAKTKRHLAGIALKRAFEGIS
ncbi:MAG: xanthine dehydrogenase family protein subunit M [Rhodobacter sp.]|nr:xanthine dehydrogenase family protein subunit M [Rhodobacter sp.]